MRHLLLPAVLSVCTLAVPAMSEVVVVTPGPGDKVVVVKPVSPIAPAPPAVVQNRIQIALLLDTSNSMDGLINQAKAQLWNIVNELSAARCGGRRPVLEVALYEYGNDGLSEGQGYIRQVLPFTSDLDRLSEALFKLTTNGGQEYCGWAMQDALTQLHWSASEADLKAIYIAGNEPFTQGPVEFHDVVRLAVAKNVLVNPIFCGPRDTGIATQWQDSATLSGGCYLSIDQDQHVVYIKAPQDDELSRLNIELNNTYIVYGGRAARESQARQVAQDAAAASLAPAVAAGRAITKSSANYSNESWDLVDAVKQNKVRVSDLKDKDLPASLAGKPAEEIQKEIDQQAARRGDIQQQIQQLSAQRTRWLADQAKSSPQHADTLEAAILTSLHQQAADKHYTFEKQETKN